MQNGYFQLLYVIGTHPFHRGKRINSTDQLRLLLYMYQQSLSPSQHRHRIMLPSHGALKPLRSAADAASCQLLKQLQLACYTCQACSSDISD